MKKTNPDLENNNNEVLLQNKANFLSQGDNTNVNDSTDLLLYFLKNNLLEHKNCDIFDHEIIENLSKIQSKKLGSNLENNKNEFILQNQANTFSQGDNTNANNSTSLLPGFLGNDNKEQIKLNNFDYKNVEKQFFNQIRDTYFNQ
ncbi:hypothetical protein GVAV_001272 [Gurleya vavrai]